MNPSDEDRLSGSRRCLLVGTALCCAAVIAAGCLEHRERVPDDTPPPWVEVAIRQVRAVDMLFVVDNSNSMTEEQEVLRENAGTLLRDLVRPESVNGEAPPAAVTDLHVGVVSTDMGTLGNTIQTCMNSPVGDDGALQNAGRLEGCQELYEPPGCAGTGCPWLAHSAARPDDGTDPSNPPIWEDFACIATLGTGGCGMEQQLEASLAALTYQTEPGGANEGFLRDDSVLVVFYVTDEDDCSTHNPELFDPSRDDFGCLCTRCAMNDDELVPPEVYADRFRALRPDDEDLIIMGAVAGAPRDGTDWLSDAGLRTLAELRIVDPADTNHMLQSCDSSLGIAYPPLRIAELIAELGENGLMESICRSDWSDALTELGAMIRSRLESHCLAEPFESDRSSCRLVEVFDDGGGCPEAASEDLGLDDIGRRECALADDLWSVDTADTACAMGELTLSRHAGVRPSSALRLECLEP